MMRKMWLRLRLRLRLRSRLELSVAPVVVSQLSHHLHCFSLKYDGRGISRSRFQELSWTGFFASLWAGTGAFVGIHLRENSLHDLLNRSVLHSIALILTLDVKELMAVIAVMAVIKANWVIVATFEMKEIATWSEKIMVFDAGLVIHSSRAAGNAHILCIASSKPHCHRLRAK